MKKITFLALIYIINILIIFIWIELISIKFTLWLNLIITLIILIISVNIEKFKKIIKDFIIIYLISILLTFCLIYFNIFIIYSYLISIFIVSLIYNFIQKKNVIDIIKNILIINLFIMFLSYLLIFIKSDSLLPNKYQELNNICYENKCFSVYYMLDPFFFWENFIQVYKYNENFPYLLIRKNIIYSKNIDEKLNIINEHWKYFINYEWNKILIK